MIGYDHPFVDGNGRTARSLFYWFMLRSGYSAIRYLLHLPHPAGSPGPVLTLLRVRAQPTTATSPISSIINSTYMLRSVDRFEQRQQARCTPKAKAPRTVHLNRGSQRTPTRGTRRTGPLSGRQIDCRRARPSEQHLPAHRARRLDGSWRGRGLLLREREGKKFIFRPASQSRRPSRQLSPVPAPRPPQDPTVPSPSGHLRNPRFRHSREGGNPSRTNSLSHPKRPKHPAAVTLATPSGPPNRLPLPEHTSDAEGRRSRHDYQHPQSPHRRPPAATHQTTTSPCE